MRKPDPLMIFICPPGSLLLRHNVAILYYGEGILYARSEEDAQRFLREAGLPDLRQEKEIVP